MYGSASELRATLEYDFLQKMRGISEMHWSVQIIRTCKKVFTKQQSILKRSLEIYF